MKLLDFLLLVGTFGLVRPDDTGSTNTPQSSSAMASIKRYLDGRLPWYTTIRNETWMYNDENMTSLSHDELVSLVKRLVVHRDELMIDVELLRALNGQQTPSEYGVKKDALQSRISRIMSSLE